MHKPLLGQIIRNKATVIANLHENINSIDLQDKWEIWSLIEFNHIFSENLVYASFSIFRLITQYFPNLLLH